VAPSRVNRRFYSSSIAAYLRAQPAHTYIYMLSKRQKTNALQAVKRHDSDTGSPEAQVALLSKKINELAGHLKKNAKDFHSRRGLLQMVADRRKHLKYLAQKDEPAYQALIKKLGLKK